LSDTRDHMMRLLAEFAGYSQIRCNDFGVWIGCYGPTRGFQEIPNYFESLDAVSKLWDKLCADMPIWRHVVISELETLTDKTLSFEDALLLDPEVWAQAIFNVLTTEYAKA